MPGPGVPRLISISAAAALAQCSTPTFRKRYLETGLLRVAEQRGMTKLIATGDLERVVVEPLFGHGISAEAYLEADRQRDDARRYQRARNSRAVTEFTRAARAVAAGHALRDVASFEDAVALDGTVLPALTDLAMAAGARAVAELVDPEEPTIAAVPADAEPVVTQPLPAVPDLDMSLAAARARWEQLWLAAQFVKHGGSVSKTASSVGMDRSALHRKLVSLGLLLPRDVGAPEKLYYTKG